MRWILLTTMLAGLCGAVFSQENEEDEPKQGLYSETIRTDGLDITMTEVERGEDYSVMTVDFRDGASVGSSMAILKGFCAIADEMGYRYIAYGKFWAEEEDELPRQKMYFTNDADTPLKELLGEDYSKEAQSIFDDGGYLDIEEYRFLFELDTGEEDDP